MNEDDIIDFRNDVDWDKDYKRESLIYNVQEDILVLMEDVGIDRVQLAEKLGIGLYELIHNLAHEGDMTLGRLSDILFELGKFGASIKICEGGIIYNGELQVSTSVYK